MELDMGRLLEAGLQNQPRSIDSQDSTYFGLLAALDAGWQIEPPVYARSRWGSAHAGQQVYHFILRSRQAITMVSVLDSPGLQVFLEEHRIAVNRK
jgi:hypothetical protein